MLPSFRPSTRAVLVAAVALLGPATAAAVEPPMTLAQAAAVPFAIPPQPLASALVAFGRQAGLQVSFDPAVAAGAASPGVTGTLAPEAALRQLLAGTGAVARFGDGGAVVVERPGQAAGDGALVLDPITVEAQRQAPSTATIGTLPPAYAGGQVATGGRVGLLGNRDLLDTPFSTQSYTEELIENQQARTVGDVLINNPSVRVVSPANATFEDFFIRGFSIRAVDAAFDGLYGLTPNARTPVEAVERVELLKGPNALLNGISPNAAVGGAINLVPKRAGEAPLAEATASYLADARLGGHADLGRRFGREGAFGIRTNLAYREGDTVRDDQDERLGLAAAALDYRGERLRLTTDLGYQRDEFDSAFNEGGVTPGFAIPDAPDASTNLQQKWETSRFTTVYGAARAEYDITDGLTASAAYGQSRSDGRVVETFVTVTDEDGDFEASPSYFRIRDEFATGEAALRGTFRTGPIGHQASLVASALWGEFSLGSAGFGSPIFSNIYDPVSVPEPPTGSVSNDVDRLSETDFTGLALADTLSALDDRVLLTLGVRRQRIETDSPDAEGRFVSAYDDSELTPAVGLVVKPLANLSLYGNYIEGLQPGETAPEDAANAGEVFPPYVAEQYEVGAKLDLGSFTATLAWFQITQPNAFTDPVTNIFDVDGEQRNRGVELELFGEPVEGVRLLGGVAYIDGELTGTAGGVNDGNTAPGVPDWQAVLGAELDLPYAPGLTLTGRMLHSSSQYYDQENTQQIPSWTRFDLGARYTLDVRGSPVMIRAAVENVADEDYWQEAGFGLVQGAPRTFLLSTSVRF
jgi:iron complex outermembrane receptor protein